MKDFVVNNSLILICKNQNYTNEKKAELKYGLEILYLNITKLVILLILSYLIGSLKETLIFFGFYALIRTFAFGLHAKSSLWCWIISIPTFVIIPYLSKIIIFNVYIKIILLVLCIINFWLYAPADTKKRPLVNKKKRIIFKILSLIVCIVYILIIIYFKNNNTTTNLIVFATLIEVIATNKVTYKLVNEKFNNYKFYKVNL